jgi:ribonucleoside-diphosphate reductase alpha chain
MTSSRIIAASAWVRAGGPAIPFRIPYQSEEALKLGKRSCVYRRSFHDESRALAEDRGTFQMARIDLQREISVRNSTVTTIAPTGTISIIADVPVGSNRFSASISIASIRVLQSVFEEVMLEEGYWSEL